MKADSYIKRVKKQVIDSNARSDISAEIEDHLNQQIKAYEAGGMNTEEAEERAVAEMGDPKKIGTLLNLCHRPKVEWYCYIYICVWAVGAFLVRFYLADHVAAPFDIFQYLGYLFLVVGFSLSAYEKYANISFFNTIPYWQGAGVIFNACALFGIGTGFTSHNFLQFVRTGILLLIVIGLQREIIRYFQWKYETKYLWKMGIAESDIFFKGSANIDDGVKKVFIDSRENRNIEKGTLVIVSQIDGFRLIVSKLD